MDALKDALARLAAVEARYHELVDPAAETINAVKAVARETANAVLAISELLDKPIGLQHLDGEPVAVLVDGVDARVIPPKKRKASSKAAKHT